MEIPTEKETTALEGRVVQLRFDFENQIVIDPLVLLREIKPTVVDRLVRVAHRFNKNIKWYIAIHVVMKKSSHHTDGSTSLMFSTAIFHGKTRQIIDIDISLNQVNTQYDESVEKIMETLESYTSRGSGWTVHIVKTFDINIVYLNPLYGASTYIRTPTKISSKKAIINIKNSEDDMCFTWCVLEFIYQQPNNVKRVSWYKRYLNCINMSGISYPVKLNDINRFEKQNSSISINVLSFEEKSSDLIFYPVYSTPYRNRKHIIHLLLLPGPTREKFHYTLINTKKDNRTGKQFNGLSKLLNSSLTKHKSAHYYCSYCYHRFCNQSNCDRHMNDCQEFGTQRTQMPAEKNAKMKFENFEKTLKVPFTIYADFESFVTPLHTCHPQTVDESLRPLTYNHPVSRHVASGFSFVVINEQGNIHLGPVTFRARTGNENVAEIMIEQLLSISKELRKRLDSSLPLVMSNEDENRFHVSTTCFLCGLQFTPLDGNEKVRHHSHSSGEFLGAAHNLCNLRAVKTQHIPVFFHNLKGYDAHHIVHALAKFKNERISCIANSSEKFMSITVGDLRFLDSYQFLDESLDMLVKNLKEQCADLDTTFKCLTTRFSDREIRDILLRKGVYCYEYMTDVTKFSENSLPPRDAFYSTLTRTTISEDDYAHAQNVWLSNDIENLGQYHDLYLITDTLLLADVFENFRKLSLKHYKLDPCHFYSSPNMSWSAMLKTTGITLQLLTDIDMHEFIERGIRGGVAQIPKRYAKANNPSLPEQYQADKPTTWIHYLDCVNLYGASMSYPLPYDSFRWLSDSEIENIDWHQLIDDNVETGYILEVDLLYPDHLHDEHRDYPLAPESRVPPVRSTFLEKHGINLGKQPKLLTTLYNKKKYIVHYRSLQLYLSLGMQLEKVHRVLCFRQANWLQPYVHLNAELRKEAKNDFESRFFKLLVNSTYGKSLENLRKHSDFKLINDKKKLDKWITQPRMKRWYIYNSNVLGIELNKAIITLNRPIYVGFTILDRSKFIMYNFHYNYTKQKYGRNVRLLMTDTDSLLYEIETENIYNDMYERLNLFDTSAFPIDHPCHSNQNKKRVGTFADEMKGKKIIKQFVGLRAKLYSFLTNDAEDVGKNVAKGVKRVSIEKDLHHSMYIDCLSNLNCTYTTYSTINSKLHEIYTMSVQKLALSPYDDKRYVQEDGIDTLPYGHYSLR
jgi:hypothetical protein